MQERERLDELRARARYEELRAKAGQSAATPQERGAQMGEYYGRGLGQMADRLPFGIGNAMDSLPRSVNLSDEMVGGAANLSTRVSNLVNRQDVDPNAAGQAAADQWRGRVQAYRDEKPVQSFVQEAAAGGAAAMLGGAGLAANAPRVAQGLSGFARSSPITTGALAGAAGGGVAGAGAGETGADRRFGALAGAGAGAVLGGAIPLAAPLVGRGANAVMRRMGRDVDDMPESMRKFFASVPDEVRNQTAENVGEAGPEFLGERLGARGERIMTDLAQQAEPAGDFARAAARRRAEQRTGRVMAEVQMRTGSRRGVDAIADRAEAEARAKPMFEAADNEMIELTPQVQRRLRQLRDGGIDFSGADRLAQMEGRNPRLSELRIDLPDVDQDAFQAALGDIRAIRRGAPRTGPTLSEFVRANGGIRDDRGDIAAALGDPRRAAQMLRQDGSTIDDLAMSAFEDGYFTQGERPTANEFIDALSRDISGNPVYSFLDADAVAQREALDASRRRFQQMGVNVDAPEQQLQSSLREALSQTEAPFAQRLRLGDLRTLVRYAEAEADKMFTAPGGNRELGVAVRGLTRGLRDEMKGASPTFREASQIWRDSRQDERAFQIGSRAFDEGRNRASIEYELRNFVGGMDDMSASERGQFLSGVLDAIERRASSAAQGGNAGSRLTRQGVQERLSIVFGDHADALADTLTREGYTASLDRLYDPNIGSGTAPRQASQGAANEALRGGGSRFAADVVQDVRGGTIGKGRTAIANRIRGASPQERERLAQLMFMESNPDANAMLNQMIDEQRRRAGLIGGAAAYGGYTAGSSNQR